MSVPRGEERTFDDPLSDEKVRRMVRFYTKDGKVVINRFNSHMNHIAKMYAPAAIPKIDTLGRRYFTASVRFNTDIGQTYVVKTTNQDKIYWAVRQGRHYWSRLVDRHEEPPWTQWVTYILKQDWQREDLYIAITGWPGLPSASEQDDVERARGLGEEQTVDWDFWKNHAFLMNRVFYHPETLTTVEPPRGARWSSYPKDGRQKKRRATVIEVM